MTLKYIDPSVSSGGSGTLVNPYALPDGLAAFNALSGNQNGDSWMFKAGTFGRLTAGLNTNTSSINNFTLGYYGTGSKPIVSLSQIKTGIWTLDQGNTWSIAHGQHDLFAWGGAAGNGVVSGLVTSNPLINPHGQRVYPVDTLAHCRTTAMSSFFSAGTLYVNLGGVNPNTVIMEYGAGAYVLKTSAANTGSVILNGVKFTNSNDCALFLQHANGANGLTITDVEVEQAGAPSGANGWDACQVLGSQGKGNYLTGLVIERFKASGCLQSLDLLWVKQGYVHDITIDNCGNGLTLWNDVVDSYFSKLNISNIVITPYWDAALPGVGFHNGILIQNSLEGVNGDSYGNHIVGASVVNTTYSALNVNAGAGHVIENCTFYNTSQQTYSFASDARSSVVAMYVAPLTSDDNVECTFSNNLVIGDVVNASGARYMMTLRNTTRFVHGNKNIYMSTGSGNNIHFAFSGTDTAVFATWQAAVASMGLDVNSTLVGTSQTPPFVNNGTLIDNPRMPGNTNYLSGFNLKPKAAEDGYADSTPVRFGSVLYTTLPTPPTVLTPTTVVDLSSTWNGTYHVVATYVTLNGETLASPDATVAVVSGATGPQVSNANAPAAQTGAIAWNVYVGTALANVKKQNTIPIAIGTGWNTGATANSPLTGTATKSAPSVNLFGATGDDANGQPFEPNNMVCGGIQNIGYCAPSRQKRASGGW